MPASAARIPWWAWAWPVAGLGRSAGDAVRRLRRHSGRGGGRHPDRDRVRCRLPRRSGRASHRRAVRHAGARARGHGHRSRPDRLGDAGGAGRKGGPRARHGVRRRHDRVQRHRRAVPALGRRAPSRAGISGVGRERGAGRAGGADHADADPAESSSATRPARSSTPRSWSSPRSCRSFSMARFVFIQTVRHRDYFLDDKEEHARAALQHGRPDQRRPAARIAGRDRGAGEISHSRGRSGIGADRGAESRGRHRDRGVGAAAGGACGAAGGARQPAADQPQSRARLGARDHRPHDSGGRRGLDRSSASRSNSASAPRIRCCWR